MSYTQRLLLTLVLAFACAGSSQEMPEGRLLRFPDIYKDKIVFMYGGDLWLASSSGGDARRITSDPGRELFPKFSPDGKWIAFTGQYDGNFNVYVMPAEGGQPRQLTFYQGAAAPLSDRMGVHNEVVTWFPDSRRILFLSRRDASNGWTKRQYSISIDGGLPQPLPLDQGGLASFSADGTKIAYNPIFRNFRTWKRYTGGLAQAISIYDLKNNTVEGVPHTDWTDTFPMWHGNTIYFSSDRGPEHHLNLYSYDLSSKQLEQLTHFTDFDVMWPSLGPDSIVFENGGYLYTFDLESKQAKKLTIHVTGDRDQSLKRWTSVARNITDFDVSPEGKRAVFAARGDVFTVPAKEGSVRNLTRTPGIREKSVAWSPDGRWIVYVSDRSGEDELYISPQDGMGAEQQITSGYKGFKYAPTWSPDSKKLAWSDKDCRLWYVDVNAKKQVEVDRGKYGEILNYSWSPDSKWLAYDKNAENSYSVVHLYSLTDSKITPVTTDMTNSFAPVFDPAGKYLYFLSDRDFNEVIGNIDFEFSNPKTTRIYLVTLRQDETSPFQPLSDETQIKKEENKDELLTSPANKPGETGSKAQTKGHKKEQPKEAPKEAKEAKKEGQEGTEKKDEKEAAKEFRIDLNGIANRIVALPIEPAIINTYQASKGFIFYSTNAIQGLSGAIPGESPAIHVYDLKERKDKVLIDGVQRFALSFDGSKLLYEADGHTYGIIDAKPDGPKKIGEGALNLSGMKAQVDPPAEWKQMFNEVWRQERDYFYAAAMNGVDWEKMREKYAQLLPSVSDRYSLTYIMGEMIGELSNSHTYVGGGDYPDLHPVNVGLLGVDFEADQAAGMYRFRKIYAGENWDPQTRSPLTEPGVTVKEGDYLIAVNGRPLRTPLNPYELFVNTVNENVTLSVNSKPTAEGAHTVQVKPVADENGLRELAWMRRTARR